MDISIITESFSNFTLENLLLTLPILSALSISVFTFITALKRNALELILSDEKIRIKHEISFFYIIGIITYFLNISFGYAISSGNNSLIIMIVITIFLSTSVIILAPIINFAKNKISKEKTTDTYVVYYMSSIICFTFFSVTLYLGLTFRNSLTKNLVITLICTLIESIFFYFLFSEIKPKESSIKIHMSVSKDDNIEDLYIYSRIDNNILIGDNPLMENASKIFSVDITEMIKLPNYFYFVNRYKESDTQSPDKKNKKLIGTIAGLFNRQVYIDPTSLNELLNTKKSSTAQTEPVDAATTTENNND